MRKREADRTRHKHTAASVHNNSNNSHENNSPGGRSEGGADHHFEVSDQHIHTDDNHIDGGEHGTEEKVKVSVYI